MHSYFTIQKINGWDKEAMCNAYTYLLGCENYKTVSREDFQKCDDGLYLAVDTVRSSNMCTYPYGIIGIRRATVEELGLKPGDMEFYSLPDKYLYSIDFLHIPNKTGFNMVGDYINPFTIGKELIREALADRNDSFAYLEMRCPTGKLDYSHTTLTENGFKVISFDAKTYTYTYIRMPKMYMNV